MSIEDLTIGEAREAAAMFSKADSPVRGRLIGSYVIVRCNMAGSTWRTSAMSVNSIKP